ncbi:MAG: T9SS type A sorting domain-containing protein [Bacteroidia bacterium]|nr:T9SS type A sorting domain-containing protein [Bacteroidia bacterium]
MKNLLYLFAFFLITNSFAQSTWVRTLNVDNMLPSVRQDSVSVGPIEMGITADKSIIGLFQINKNHKTNLIKLDSSGAILWNINVANYGGIYGEYCYSFHTTNDNGCVYVFRHDSWGSGTNDVISKRNESGFQQWSKSYNNYGTGLNTYVQAFLPTSYSTYLLQFTDSLVELDSSGYFIRSISPFSGKITALNDTTFLVNRTTGISREDFNGTQLWFCNATGFAIISADSNTIFASKPNEIIKIDTQTGNILWSRPISTGWYTGSTYDGGLITTYPDSFGNSIINKLDSSGALIWTNTEVFCEYGFRAIMEITPNSYIAGGGWKYESYFSNEFGISPFVCRIDSTGNNVLDSTHFFYAGNANDNNLLDFADDAVYIAAAMTTNGIPREQLLQNYFLANTYATNWNENFSSGINYKYSDFDGNGSIDTSDIRKLDDAIYRSFSCPSHYQRISNTQTIPELHFAIENQYVNAGDTVVVNVILGSASVQVDSIYGLSFRSAFNSTTIPYDGFPSTPYFSIAPTSLGDTSTNLYNYFSYDLYQQEISMVLCRNDHNNAIVAGDTIITFYYPIPATVPSDVFRLVFGANMITEAGFPIPYTTVFDSLFITNTTGIIENSQGHISIYPTPCDKETNILTCNDKLKSVFVYDRQGNLKKKFDSSERNIKIETVDLASGIYFVKIISSENNYIDKFVVIH